MLSKLRLLVRRRRALSKAAIIIIIVVSSLVAIAGSFTAVYFTVIRDIRFSREVNNFVSNIQFGISSISDSNEDSLYEEINFQINNSNSQSFHIIDILGWTTTQDSIGDSNQWDVSVWSSTSDNISVSSLEKQIVDIFTEQQLELSIYQSTYFKMEFTIQTISFSTFVVSEWLSLNELADLTDLIIDFEAIDLSDWSFSGTIDDPIRAANSYSTNSDGDYQLVIDGFNYLPVINETESIPFYMGTDIMVFHSPNGNLSTQSLVQNFTLTTPVRTQKIYLLGLSGSWGDEFPTNDIALTLNVTYTDGSSAIWELGQDYIDDWWYSANPGGICISAPTGVVTEIDLGTQIDTPHSYIHSHTVSFELDYFKYIQSISFIDPGDDISAPHLLAITLG